MYVGACASDEDGDIYAREGAVCRWGERSRWEASWMRCKGVMVEPPSEEALRLAWQAWSSVIFARQWQCTALVLRVYKAV